MNNPLTLGSLFSGSGGFELAGRMCGVEPIWASEIEPFGIRVTTKRLPSVKHLGDINKINGASIPAVDIITAGFPCQNLSVAGNKVGLHGDKSGLFFQVIRIIKEMRAATDNKYPKFAVLENVMGLFSSNGGQDFWEVLNELCKLNDETAALPRPQGKWYNAGEIMADSYSIGWRTLNAQFWGTAQRRRRCYIAVDFTGERVGKILFDETRLRGDSAAGERTREGASGGSEDSAGSAVAIENHPSDSRVKLAEDGIVQTLSSRMGTGGNNVPLVINVESAAFLGGQDVKARSIAYSEEMSPTLRSAAGGNSVPMVVYGICSKSSNSMKSKNPHSGIYETQTAKTLDTSYPDPNKNAGGMAVVALEGNGSRPSHRGDGYSEEDISYTLNSVERHAVCYPDKAAVENYQYGGYREVDKAGTLTASGGDYPGGENLVIDNRYVVRRLTPSECAMLQGFSSDWCADLNTPEPSEDDIAFWTDVFNTKAGIDGVKSKSRNQIIKWLQSPHSDSAEYRLWGNGIALPCAEFVLGGVVNYMYEIKPRIGEFIHNIPLESLPISPI